MERIACHLAFLLVLVTGTAAQASDCSIDLVIAMANSASTCEDQEVPCKNWEAMTDFMFDIAKDLNLDDDLVRIGAMMFGTMARQQWTLDWYTTNANIAGARAYVVDAYQGVARPNITDALLFLREGSSYFPGGPGDRPNVRNVGLIILVSSPVRDSLEWRSAVSQAEMAHEIGIQIVAVGITDNVDLDFLEAISSYPHTRGQSYLYVSNYGELTEVSQDALGMICEPPPPVTSAPPTVGPTIPSGSGTTGAPTSLGTSPVVTPTPTSLETTGPVSPETNPSPAPRGCELDLCIVLDDSGSICDTDPIDPKARPCSNWRAAVEFTRDIVETFNIEDGSARVGLILFSSSVRVLWSLDRYNTKSALISAVDGLLFDYNGGQTHTNEALQAARERCFNGPGDRDDSEARDVMLVITDGLPFPSDLRLPAIAQAQLAQGDNIVMYAVGVTANIDEDFLKAISSAPRQRDVTYFTSASFATLNEIKDRVAAQTCDETISSKPTETFPDCNQLDLAFVIDSSGSICDSDDTAIRREEPPRTVVDCANWRLVINFMERFVQSMIIGPNNVKVGMVRFANEGYFHWDLNSYSSSSSLLGAIKTFAGSYEGGKTYTAAGLSLMSTQVFNVEGDRPDVPNVAIVITDGYPTKNVSQTLPQALAAKNSGINIFTIGVTDQIDEEILRDLSSPPQQKDKTYFVAPDFTSLIGVLNPILNSSCRATPPPTAVGECKIDLVIVLDDSGSICDSDPDDPLARPCGNWKRTIDFAKSVVRQFNIDDGRTRVGLIMFSSTARDIWYLDTFATKKDLLSELDGLLTKYEGQTTATDEAMKMVLDGTKYFINGPGDRTDATDVVLVISDGAPFPNSRKQPALNAAYDIQQAGIIMFAVGITDEIEEDVLKALSSSPRQLGRNYFTSPGFDVLEEITDIVAEQTCKGGEVTPLPVGDCEIDLIIVLDDSGSICDNDPVDPQARPCGNWKLVVEFAKKIVTEFNIDGGKTRVGLIMFSSTARGIWYLDTYDNKVDILAALDGLLTSYVGGTTATNEAMEMVLDGTKYFPNGPGTRATAVDVVLTITDGLPFPEARKQPALNAAKRIRDAGIIMFAVGITNLIEEEVLKALSSNPQRLDQNYFTSPNFEVLDEITGRVAVQTCKGGEATPPPVGDCEIDLVIVLDDSGSICDNDPVDPQARPCGNWRFTVEFAKSIVDQFDINDGKTKIGLIMFSTTAREIWYLNSHTTKDAILAAMDELLTQYEGGTTATNEAMEMVLDGTKYFPNGPGTRSGATDVVLTITDGVPHPEERKQPALEAAKLIRESGIIMFAVGITNLIEEDVLKGLSSSPQRLGQNYFTSPDFDVLEEIVGRVAQQTCKGGEATPPPVGECKIDLVIVLDDSGSICDNDPVNPYVRPCGNWRFTVEFAKSIINQFNIDDGRTRVGLIKFSSFARDIWYLNTYSTKQAILTAMDGLLMMYEGGTTATNEAMEMVLDGSKYFPNGPGVRSDAENVVLVITDGLPFPESRKQPALDAAKRIQDAGIIIYAVGITNLIEEDVLKALSSSPRQLHRNYFTSPDFDVLEEITGMVAQQTCGGGEIVTPAPVGECKIDLVIVLDDSGSICDNDPNDPTARPCGNWKLTIEFAKNVVNQLNIDDGRTRVGLIKFSSTAIDVWYLNSYDTKDGLLTALDGLLTSYVGDTTATDEAMKMVLDGTKYFINGPGDRPDAIDVVLVISDGAPFPDSRRQPALNAANDIQQAGIIMFAVGITDDIEEDVLKALSSNPRELGRNYFTSASFNALVEITDTVVRQTCKGAEVTPLPVGDCEIDLVIVLDDSGSICDNDPVDPLARPCGNWILTVEFAKSIVNHFKMDDGKTRVGLIMFSSSARDIWYLNKYNNKVDILAALDGLLTSYVGGTTATNEAMEMVLDGTKYFPNGPGTRATAVDVVLTITDGVPFPEIRKLPALNAAMRIRDAGIIMFAVGITNLIEEDVLKALSSNPQNLGQNYFTSPTFDVLDEITGRVAVQTCKGGEVTPPPVGDCEIDLVIVLDDSGSICDNDPVDPEARPCGNWRFTVEFAKSIVAQFDINDGKTKIGLIMFSTTARDIWYLNSYTTKDAILAAMDELLTEYQGGVTATNEAMEMVLDGTKYFPNGPGTRSGATDVVLTITDGVPHPEERKQPALNAAKLIRESGIIMFAVGITNLIEEDVLKGLSSSPQRLGQNYFTSPDFYVLEEIVGRVAQQTCKGGEATPPPVGECKIDLVIVLDDSGSICDNDPVNPYVRPCGNWRFTVEFAKSIINQFNIDDGRTRVGLIKFSSLARDIWYLNTYSTKQAILTAMDGLLTMYEGGTTATNEAMEMVLDGSKYFPNGPGVRPDAENVVLVITDGVPYPDNRKQPALDAAKRIQDAGIIMYAVGITNLIEEDVLKALSSSPRQLHRNYFTSPDFDVLEEITGMVAQQTCGGGEIVTPAPVGECKIDLVIVLDDSGSICDSDPDDPLARPCGNWKLTIDFAKNAVSQFNIDDGRTRVGLIMFSSTARDIWYLNSHDTKGDILAALDGLLTSYVGGTTATDDAMNMVLDGTKYFINGPGDRPDATDVVLVISDGAPFPDSRRQPALNAANDIQQAGIIMFAVGITDDIEEDVLKALSSNPRELGRNYFTSASFSALVEITDTVVRQTCKGGEVTPLPVGDCEIDLVIVLDDSGSICDNDPVDPLARPCGNWILTVEFAKSVVNQFKIDDGKTRVGLIKFSSSARDIWYLNTYDNKVDILAALDGLLTSYVGGTTATNEAMELVLDGTKYFPNGPGTRATAVDVVLTITDGLPFPEARKQPALNAAKRIRDAGIIMFAVGITNLIEEDVLKALSSNPQRLDQNYFTSPNFDVLDEITGRVAIQTCKGGEVTPPPVGDCEIDLVIVLDDSGSICDNDPVDPQARPCGNWIFTVEFAKSIVDQFNINDGKTKIGLIMFSTTARDIWYLNSYTTKDAILAAMDELLTKYEGGTTATNEAMEMVLDGTKYFLNGPGTRPNATNVVLTISDGVPFPEERKQPALNAAKLIRESGIIMFAVGITNLIEEDVLKGLSSSPQRLDQNYFTSPDFNVLEKIVGRVAQQTCKGGEATPTPVGECKIDLVIVLDDSGSICDNDPVNPYVRPCGNWRFTVEFAKSIVSQLNIDDGRTRVGLLMFSNSARDIWYLDSYSTKQAMLTALDGLLTNYVGGTTATNDAMEMVLDGTKYFMNGPGVRPDARKVVLVITDGVPYPDNRKQPALDAAKRIQDAGIIMYAVGITNLIEEDVLKALSSSPRQLDRNYFTSPDFDVLELISGTVGPEICRNETITPPASTTTITTPRLDVGDCKIDLIIILDDSGSICDNDPIDPKARPCSNWMLTLDFTKNVISKFNIDDKRTQIGLITFSNSAKSILKVGQCKTQVDCLNEVEKLSLQYEGGETYTDSALQMAIRSGLYFPSGEGVRNAPDVIKVILIITDGVPNPPDRQAPALSLAQEAQNMGITMFAVGITNEIKEEVLKALSSQPRMLDANYFTSVDFGTLNSIVNNVALKTCTVTSTPITTMPTIKPPRNCQKRHIVFVLDESGSIGPKNFQKAKTFVSDLVDILDVDYGTSSFGLITFATDVEKQFDRCSNTVECQRMINQVAYGKGKTNTGDAIKYVRNNMMSNIPSDTLKVLVVLTDGGSQDKAKTVKEAMEAKTTMTILVLGVGDWIDRYELMSIASDPYEKTLFYSPSFNDLSGLVDQLEPLLCKGVTVCEPNPCRRGTCLPGINMYTCICPDRWGGQICDYECAEPADVVFALDASGSIGNDNFLQIVEFVKDIARLLPIGTNSKIGMLTYGNTPEVYFDLTTYSSKVDILNALSIPYYSKGSTNTADAIREMIKMFDGSTSTKVGIIITDGHSNNPDMTWAEARRARESDIIMLSVGIGSDARIEELEAISSYPTDDNVFKAADFANLSPIVDRIVDTICHADNACNVQPRPCPGGTCRNVRNGFTCVCPPNRSGFSCDRNCAGDADLLFIIDKSGSIRNNRFQDVKNFIIQIIKEFEWNEDRIRIATVSFSETSDVNFKLNEYSMRQDQIEAINRISYVGKRTNIAAALRDAREIVFSTANGDRSDVPNYIIMFSDGGANIDEDQMIPEAVKARIAGAYIVNVAVGLDMNMMALRGIVSNPVSRNVITTKSFNDLTTDVARIAASKLCNDRNECSGTSCQNGGTCVDGLGEYLCVCRSQNTGRNCERTCAKEYDVIFVLDLSTSVDMAYNYSISFIEEVIHGLKIRDGTVQVGLVSYCDGAVVVFYLNTYRNKQDMIQALSFSEIGGKTNSQGALRTAKDQMLRPERGDRSNVPNIIIMLTDGNSNVDRSSTIPMANQLKTESPATIYVQAVGECIHMEEIRAIASEDEEPYVQTVTEESQVKDKAGKLLDHLCI